MMAANSYPALRSHLRVEDESNSNEPSTSTEEGPENFRQAFEGSAAASMEADSGSQHSAELQTHPQDKSILDMIDKYHTRRCTQWAIFCWNSWRLQQYDENPDQPVLPFFYEICERGVEDSLDLDKTLAKFVTDCKNKSREDYTPETLRGILFGLQRFLKSYCSKMDKKPMAFIKNEYQFPKYCKALKKKIEDLNEVGINRRNAQAVGITPQQEEYLWDVGIFGGNSAEVLSNTVFFYIVKIFGIASSYMLRIMKSDTFVFGENDIGKFIELDSNFASELDIYDQTSICHNLALLAPNTATKLRHYCNESNPRTFYNILKYYTEMIKLVATTDHSLFLKPKKEMMFSNVGIGRLQLQKKFGKMMAAVNFQGYYTTQALVQSCLDNLQIKGYMVRRKQSFLPSQQVEICKLLDPPPGIIKTIDVETHTKAVLQLVNTGQRIPVQSLLDQTRLQYVVQLNQTPQSSGLLNETKKKNIESMDFHTALHASQTSLHSRAAYVSTVSNLTNQLTAANQVLPHQAVTPGIVPVSTCTVNRLETEPIQNETITQGDDSALSKEVFPLFISKAEIDGKYGSVNEPENDSDGTNDYEFDNVIIKQEPANYEGECFQSSESLNVNQCEISRKRKPDTVKQTNEISPRKMAKNEDVGVKSDKHKSNDESRRNINKIDSRDQGKEIISCEESEPIDDESMMCSAEIEYSFNNDLNKKITKQEVSLKEDDQTMFNFSGTNKMGRSVGDLDINLGDYLPENCTIKPGNINIKRVSLPDGGKMVIKLKYSVDK